jgi:PAS domain S-box-containing protein
MGKKTIFSVVKSLIAKISSGMDRNITDSESLDKQIRLLQHWIENSVDLFFWVQDDSQILYVNKAVCKSLGYTLEELCSMKVGDFDLELPHDAWPGFTKKLRKQRSLCFESRLRMKNGQEFPVEITANVLEFEGKDHFFAYGRDIRHKKQLNSELQLVKYSIEHSAFPFAWIQDDSRFLYVNESTCSSLGYTREEMCSMKVSDIDPDFPPEVWPEFWEKLKSQKSLTIETYHIRKNGEKFPVEIVANYVEFEERGHVFAYVKDISEKIRAEEDRKELEKQLLQTQKMESIGTLAGGIAHDFNNILTALFGYAEMVIQDLPPESSAHERQLQVIKAANRAKELVQQILLFSRQGDQEVKPIQPSLIIKEALKLLRSSIPATIQIKQSVPGDCGSILADPTQIHQIIMNLCTNAYHAMREEGGVLEVSLSSTRITENGISFTSQELDPGQYIKLEVTDTGHGMDEQTKDKIFNPYFTTKKKGEGTGLGLSVVHGIVKNFGGHISVDSETDKGTNIQIYFPKLETDDHTSELQVDKHIPVGNNERILVIDDEETILNMMKEMLENLNYRVVTQVNSEEALKLFQAKPDDIDLVITDMTMPYMTGLELAKKLFVIRPKMPTILCTGFSETVSEEKARGLGVRKFLTKPILRSDLATAIRQVLDEKNMTT